jgi:hypothetical protein
MREMDFVNGIQNPWTNVTVRRGYKWADLRIGEMIELLDKKIPMGLKGIISQVTVKRFKDIKVHELRREHDRLCRSRTGLLRTMKSIYPDFSVDDVVTIVTYVVRKDKPNNEIPK